MRNPWSAFLLPPPPPPATPGRARGLVWCPVLPPTVTIVTSSPQRNQKTVCMGEPVNEMKTFDPNPHLFFYDVWERVRVEAILKSGNSGKELVCDSVFLSQLYFTDLASEMLAFGKGIILLQLIYHYYHVSTFLVWVALFYVFCADIFAKKFIQWQYEWTSSM